MAFDGIAIAGLVKEFNNLLTGARIYKIAQPESDELLITLKTNEGQQKLLLSAGASLPLAYLTDVSKQSPMTAPSFCMLLRKHLQNGRITAISQPGLERIIVIEAEHYNEMGDLCTKKLIIEIMGKHSNIIFTDSEDMILDSIKHISGMVSSVREVLPGRTYFIPKTQDKLDPLQIQKSIFVPCLTEKNMPLYKALYSCYTGLSPVIAQELCYRAGLDGDESTAALKPDDIDRLYEHFHSLMMEIQSGSFSPEIIYHKDAPYDFSAVPLTIYRDYVRESFSSMSAVLERYYSQKSIYTRIRQKSVDLRKIVQTALERNTKKYDLQVKQLQDTQKREKYKVYGELIHTYGYGVAYGSKSMEALNYYTNETITIPLDETMTPAENAQRYFDKYNKMKRTDEALSALILEVKEEIEHLETISNSLDIAQQEEDLVQIKEELIESGYIRRKGGGKKVKITSKPFHYRSSDGFDLYVGKNNLQNDELTFKFASGNDWWFHAKGMPGSHVIVKSGGADLPDRCFEEAARLAAYYSKGRNMEKVEIDYTEKKNVKKPSGSKPGFVVYYTNYSLIIDSDISQLTRVDSE